MNYRHLYQTPAIDAVLDDFHHPLQGFAAHTYFLQRHDFAVFEMQHRLEIERRAQQARGPADAPATVQVFERVHGEDNVHIVTDVLHALDGNLERLALTRSANCGQHLHPQPHRSRTRIYQLDVQIWQIGLRLYRRGQRPAQLRRDENAQNVRRFVFLRHFLKKFDKRSGRRLRRRRESLAFLKPFVKRRCIQGDTIQVRLLAPVHRQGNHRYIVLRN